jgi:hypothetical protein
VLIMLGSVLLIVGITLLIGAQTRRRPPVL